MIISQASVLLKMRAKGLMQASASFSWNRSVLAVVRVAVTFISHVGYQFGEYRSFLASVMDGHLYSR